MNKLFTSNRPTGGGRYPDAFEIPGFRVALPPEADQPQAEAIASLPGMTIELYRKFLSHHLASVRLTLCGILYGAEKDVGEIGATDMPEEINSSRTSKSPAIMTLSNVTAQWLMDGIENVLPNF